MKTENKKTLEQFFAREYNKLINYVHIYLSDKYFNVDAEDIIQDVALNIYSKLDINAPIENLAGYFFRALRNKIIDYQRKPRFNVSLENIKDENDENLLLKTVPDNSIETEDFGRNEELQKKLMMAIEKLKPDQQAIIIETEFEGHTFEELSNRWNIPVGTLLSRKHRAMNKLQKMLLNEINNDK